MKYPTMTIIRQTFDSHAIENVYEKVKVELIGLGVAKKIKHTDSVAITAGSRGIDQIGLVTKAIVDFVKNCNAEPYVVPTMGSHGGADSEGQIEVLAQYGITEKNMGCSIVSNMDVEIVGETNDGLPVHVDKHLLSANHIIVVNRIKPHTKFEGAIESGLMKMMAIGMGNHLGAKTCHLGALNYGMYKVICTVAQEVLEKTNILCGIGLVEDGYDKMTEIQAIHPTSILGKEKKLLIEARKRMARIPFADIDLLIVDEMGKNISGSGMDTNVTGKNRDALGSFTNEPRTKRLFVRDLTDETDGNAVGIGLADFTTDRLVKKIDRKKTNTNCIAAVSPEKGAIPIFFEKDKDCIDAALQCLYTSNIDEIKVVHIKNTLSISKIAVSKAYKAEIEKNKKLKRIGDWKKMTFNDDGNIQSPF